VTPEERAGLIVGELTLNVSMSDSNAGKLVERIIAAIFDEREACEAAVKQHLDLHAANDDYAKGLAVALCAIRART
jgi:hypothetical protein